MIHINHDKSRIDFQDLAKEHYLEFYHDKKDEQEKAQCKLIDALDNSTIKTKYKNLYDILKDNISDILQGKPDKLWAIVSKIKKAGYDIKAFYKDKKKGEKNEKGTYTELGQALKDIFNYDDFIKKHQKKYNAYRLVEKLGVEACPYCNRQYTITVTEDLKTEDNAGKKEVIEQGQIVRPALDHFFPKSYHPYLALSFYNLIPSCTVCNSSLKRDKEFNIKEHVNPYKEGFGADATFTYIPSCYEDLVGMPYNSDTNREDEMIITFLLNEYVEKNKEEQAAKIDRIKNNIEVFKLEELYTEHRNYVRELIRKRVISNSSYLKNLAKAYDGLFASEAELYNIAFGNLKNEEDYLKRPMAKLTHDIVKELGLDKI
jgi:hypothetical protein